MLSVETIEQQVRTIVAEIAECEPEKVLPDSHFVMDLGADSMSVLELAVALEQKFNITIEPERLPDMTSVRSVSEVVRGALENGAG